MPKIRLIATALAAVAASTLAQSAYAGDEPQAPMFERMLQNSYAQKPDPSWKEGWTWPLYSGLLEGCTKSAFSNMMHNARPGSWWPHGATSPASLPATLLWAYGSAHQPKLLEVSVLLCTCQAQAVAAVVKFADLPSFQQSPQRQQVVNVCSAAVASALAPEKAGKQKEPANVK